MKLETNMLKADLHTHTREDPEDTLPYSSEALIDMAAESGHDVLAITNHNIITYSDELVAYAESKGIVLISGVEVDIERNHVVILNTSKDVLEETTFSGLKKYKESHPEIFILAPHPLYPSWKCLRSNLLTHIELFDAIEYCHYYFRFFNYYNIQAEKIAQQFNKPLIGTSDSHRLYSLNTTFTLIDAGKSKDAILDALRNNRVEIKTSPLSIWQFFKLFIPKFIRKLIFD